MHTFVDPLHAEFAEWAMGFVTSDGFDVGEVDAVAASMAGDDDAAYFDAWHAAATRHVDAGDAALAAGHGVTALHHHSRAAVALGVAYHPLYGTPVDPRLLEAFRLQQACFAKIMALVEPPGEVLSIPFDGHQMPGYFLPGAGATPGERRPVVVLTNGYDATMVELYFGAARAMVERGYHCIIFDGPGQGTMLVEHGVTMVADWERVVAPVVDVAVGRSDVDVDRIALYGWSLGGYLAPRAATGEHRLAACIADPGLWSVSAGMAGLAQMFGLPDAALDALPTLPAEVADQMTEAIAGDRGLRWRVMQRGYWVNGATDLQSYLDAVWPFTLDGHGPGIRCPVLVTQAEGDVLAAGAGDFAENLAVPVTRHGYSAAEGAGGHCEMLNRALVVQRSLDWLDEVLAGVTPATRPA